jgi:hypothetical protein
MRNISCFFLIVALLASVGCSGGLNCPFQRPQCCDNALFGCGTFDLPQGCSCDDYLSRALRDKGLFSAPLVNARALTSANGTWRLSLSQTQSSCPGMLRIVSGNVDIRERRGRVSVKTPGYGTLRGRTSRGILRASGVYKPFVAGCSASVSSTMTVRTGQGPVRTSIDVNCGQLQCSMVYEGQGRKL